MGNLYEYVKMAVHNIMANKGRSFLLLCWELLLASHL